MLAAAAHGVEEGAAALVGFGIEEVDLPPAAGPPSSPVIRSLITQWSRAANRD